MKLKIFFVLSIFVLSLFSAGAYSYPTGGIAVTSVYWYQENSTLMPVPGMSNVPLYVTIKNIGQTIYDFTASINLTYPFSYGSIILQNGTVTKEKTVITLPEFPSGATLNIQQLVNISGNARNGIYVQGLNASGYINGTMVKMNTVFYVPLEGNVKLFVAGSYVGMGNKTITPMPGMKDVPVTFIIGNAGNSPVIDVNFSYVPQYPFYGEKENYIITGIPSYGYVPIVFFVNITDEYINTGMYEQKINAQYYSVNENITFNFTWSYYADIQILSSYLGAQGTIIQGTGNMKNIPLTVNIINTGNEIVENLTVKYDPQYPFYGNEQSIKIPAVLPYTQIPLTFIVSTYSTINNGFYNNSLYVSYYNRTETLNFTTGIFGYGNISVMYSYLGSPAMKYLPGPGMQGLPLNVVLTEIGNAPLSSFNVTYDPQYPFYGNVQKFNFPGLSPYRAVNLTFIVNIYQNASTGNYVQYLNINYGNINEIIPFNVSILGKGELKINGYVMDPPYVYENYSFNRITFFITNTGTSPLENLNITVLSNGLKIINKPMTLSILPPYIPFNYTVLYNSPSTPGNYYINLTIGNVSYNVNINVLKDPQIIVTKDFPQITPGASKLQLTFYIKNNGPEEIKMMQIHFIYPQILSLHVSSSNPLEGLYLNNVTLVNLNVNENYSIPYVVDVADNAQPGVYTGQLIFSIFTENSTEPIIESYTFTFQVSTPFFSTGNVQSILSLPDITIFILLVIIAILAIMYIRLLRKIRKH